ncbi:MAG: PAS domain S-box protein [Clostridiales Family XIII bacterium]|jgi:PAS domain S-box-containing protein|nr:PAS domain S-box protein [Clostridiales Family XIII bacterium]
MENTNYGIIIMGAISLIACIVLLFVVALKAQRSRVKIAFNFLVITMSVWNIGSLLEITYRDIYGYTDMTIINFTYIAICIVPIAVLYFGKTISDSYWSLTVPYIAILIIPISSVIMVFTNPLHQLFFEKFSIYSSDAIYGYYFYLHTAYSYSCILVGLVYLFMFTIHNTGVLSKQSLFVIIGVSVPLVGNILFSFGIIDSEFGINSSLFTVTVVCFAIAFVKYKFIAVVPIAVRQIVDLISDGYIVVDSNYNIVDYNRALEKIVGYQITKSKNLTLEALSRKWSGFGFFKTLIDEKHLELENNIPISLEKKLDNGSYYDIELTPVFQKTEMVGIIILLKDISTVKRALETIQTNQTILMERERLISLGQIAGGIAHNLRTPLISIAGALEALKDLDNEYMESIGDSSITPEDHKEIATEISSWIAKIEGHCDYISDLITTIKGQAGRTTIDDDDTFTIFELMKQVEILMKHELTISHCTLNIESTVDNDSIMVGDINSLVQIFDNVIVNAIHAYDGREGSIKIAISKTKDFYIFKITDHAGGMPHEVRDKLFKEMVTTKGKNGTGLGLYTSYSKVKGMFNGDMAVDTFDGIGVVMTITIPIPLYQEES